MAPVVGPNFGLYLDRPAIDIPRKALKDGYGFRIKNGALSNLNLGWERFYGPGISLGSRVMAIANFFPRNLSEKLMFFTQTDVFVHDENNDEPVFLTPIYDGGTAAASGTAVTGTTTTWLTQADGGNFIHFGDADYHGIDDWFEIDTVDSDTGITLVEDAGTVVDGPYTIRQTFVGNSSNLWSVTVFMQDEDSGDDLVIATNGIDPVITWNGTDATVTEHPELMFTADAVVTFANMVIYINVVTGGISYPTSFINSDVGKPLAAGATGTGLSEQFRVTDKPDPLLGGVVLGNNLVLYSRRQGIVAQFAGDPLVFIFRVAFSGTGPIAARAIADFGDYHEFLGPDAEYAFDGVALREINSHVGRDIIRTGDPARRAFAYGHFDEENGDLIWSVPGTVDTGAGEMDSPPETAWPEHYLERVPPGVERPFSKRAWPFTATGYYTRQTGLTWQNAAGTWGEYNYAWNDQFSALAFPLNLGGTVDGDIFIINQSQTADGEPLPSFVRFGRQPTDDGRMRALVARIFPFTGQLNATLDVTLWLADFATSTALNGGTYQYDTSHVEGEFFVTPYRRARYVEVQFGTDSDPWTLEGYDILFRQGGQR